MFDNTITLNPTGQLGGTITGGSPVFDRVTQDAEGAGSMWRVPGSALTAPQFIVIKHDVRKGKGYNYQGSSFKQSFTLSDSVTGQKAQFDTGFYLNVPQGTFASNVVQEVRNAVARSLYLIRADGIVEKLLNMEG